MESITFLALYFSRPNTITLGYLAAASAFAPGQRIGCIHTRFRTMAASGACAASMGWLFGGPPTIVIAVAILWGITVIADSAQFSDVG